MKALRSLALLSAFALAACHERQAQQAPQPDEQEVERRVQARLADEHRAEADRQAREREQQLNDREQKLAAREQEMEAQQQATPEPTEAPSAPAEPERAEVAESYQTFYDALAPYGAWIELGNYGYVWQPRVALQNARWRPYTVGHWAHTDYGWTWISNEPWGWATYHYGRWARLRRLGWIWVPDDQWAPAWVSWRNSDRYIGWAALPPEARFDGSRGIREWADEQYGIASDDYTFVPASEFGDDELAAVALPPEQNVTFIDDTVNVTNIIQSNAFIINNGPNFLFVNAHARKHFAQLRVERKPESRGGQNLAEVKGETLQIVAPHFKKSNHAEKPAQVAERTTDVKAARPIDSSKHAQSSPTTTPAQSSEPNPQATPDPLAAVKAQQRALRENAERARNSQRATPFPTAPAQNILSAPTAPPSQVVQPNSPQTTDPRAAVEAQQRAVRENAQRVLRERQIEAQRAVQEQAIQQQQVETQHAPKKARESQPQQQQQQHAPAEINAPPAAIPQVNSAPAHARHGRSEASPSPAQ